jgi:hypothetical protein
MELVIMTAISKAEWVEFLLWRRDQITATFNNRAVLRWYYQDDVTVPHQACKLRQFDFIQTGNFELLLEAATVATACNKVFQKQLLKCVGIMPIELEFKNVTA